jgi:hypothetical protein
MVLMALSSDIFSIMARAPRTARQRRALQRGGRRVTPPLMGMCLVDALYQIISVFNPRHPWFA